MKNKKEYKKLVKLIKKSKIVFIMNHKNLDLDAIGSSLGMYSIVEKMKKEVYIIIDEEDHEAGVNKVLHEIEGTYHIIKSEDLPIYLNKKNKKNLLIILDTNKKGLLQSDKPLEYIDKIAVLDHHELGEDSLTDCLMINEEISSTSEMVLNFATSLNMIFSPSINTVLLAGIILDTNNFSLKTNSDTYYSAYTLSSYGGSTKKVQYLLKQDIETYSERQKLLSNIIFKKGIAIAKGTPNVIYRREDLAKVADTLLFFNDVEISFVIGKISKDEIGISARSIGNKDISKVMTSINGGGDTYNGAAVFKGKKISEVYDILLETLKGDAK